MFRSERSLGLLVSSPLFGRSSAVAQVASHIIAGEAYKPDVLNALTAQWDARPSATLRASNFSKIAVICLRLAEEAIGHGDRLVIDARLDTVAHVVNEAIANTPSDPFLWLVLFWLDNRRNWLRPEALRYLRMSYALGPNEAWIALKRNHLSLAIFPALPAELKEAAISEFIGLVNSGLYDDAADIVTGPGWPERDVLMGRLKDLKDADRRGFAKVLYDRGVDGVSVPGIEPPPPRPWR